ncbi:hypothetical protein REC12_08430 [Desulfosporosinus sp. PR]|uniref:hypothetical protein n=1 Tax=Candidatus Desulfosporosinus nitrosoreducens TaxID=3401928 RepID=UPI0027FAF9CA|nr:hypothetical protein [Desulfosporosinus sp. PR]MDQ7093613.1 hypothetical protein [Desulfosporosinus sp. PR]
MQIKNKRAGVIMTLDSNLIFWPGLVIVFGIPTLIFIPKEQYKKFLIFGFVLGGVVDVLTIVVIGNMMGEFHYIAGSLEAFGIPVFIPIAFTFVWMLFLYFLPFRVEFLIPYVIGFVCFAIMLGFVQQNLGFFQFEHGPTHAVISQVITFGIWFSASALIYRAYNKELSL